MNAHITGNDLKNTAGSTITLGDGKTYHLVIDMNALCEIEDRYGDIQNAIKVLSNIGKVEKGPDGKIKPKKYLKDIRFLLWVALQHDNDELTEREAAKLVTLGNVNEVMNALGAAMRASAHEGNNDEKNVKNPQEA